MFKFDHTDVQRTAVSTVGALLLSAACVFAAVGPAKAEAPASLAKWQGQVERQVDQLLAAHADQPILNDTSAVVRVTLGGDGKFVDAKIARTSGSTALDNEALRTARLVSYPALPNRIAGQPTTVAMQVLFGRTADSIAARYKVANQDATLNNQRFAKRAERTQFASLPRG